MFSQLIKFVVLIVIMTFSCLEASEMSRQNYLKFIKEYPNLVTPPGDASKGEIEIILDPGKMLAIERKTGRDVGIVARDKFWIWINDACKFPSGAEGVYGRILQTKSLTQASGVAVMPILPDGRIALNCNYRHATRSWEIELPRGGVEPGENPESAAKRETLEETGMEVEHLVLLGAFPPDSGLSAVVAPIYAALVAKQGAVHRDAEEAIEEIFALSVEEIKQGFKNGYIFKKVRGDMTKVYLRDPFLAYALLLYEIKNTP